MSRSISKGDICRRVITARQGSCGEVMFSVVCLCVCMCVCSQGIPVTVTHYALNLTIHGHLPALPLPHGQGPPDPILLPLLVTSGGQDWGSVQTCSLEKTPSPRYLVASGQYASYWNACLLDKLQPFSQSRRPHGFPVLPHTIPVERKNVHWLWMGAAGRNRSVQQHAIRQLCESRCKMSPCQIPIE